MKEDLVKLIVERLERDLDKIREEFSSPKDVRTRFAAIDDVFPDEIARQIYEAFPPVEQMRLMSNFRERKYTSKSFEKMNPLIAEASLAFQAPEVIEVVTKITGMKDMSGDPHFYAGGISAMTEGQFLNPHLDNSHDHERKNYRVLNLLYYTTPDWQPEYGGNLELWDTKVRQCVEIPSLFNRLVLMETNQWSWHSVNQVRKNGKRCCVSNYYFSPHTPNNGEEVFHITFFQARPEQHLSRLVTTADGYLRSFLRQFNKEGFSKEDLYKGQN